MTQEEFYEEILGLPELKITTVVKSESKLIFHCEYQARQSNCPSCGEPTAVINQYDSRKVRDLNISGREVWLHVQIPQFICPSCHRYFFKNPPWVEKGKSYTKRQEKYIFELCKHQPFTEVGALVNMSHKTVERLYYAKAEREINLRKRYSQVRKLGIDEVSKRKGKKDYACVLVDLERGIQLDVLPSRHKSSLIAHFQSLGVDFCNQIETVCIDMWAPYADVAKVCFPNAELVVDRFHVVKSLNEVLDKLRKSLRKQDKKEDCFKHIKWKLFKRPEKCTADELSCLNNAFQKSWMLEEIYTLRNTFNSMFDVAKDKASLTTSLKQWINHAVKLNHKHLNTFIRTLKNWKTQIAAFASQKITNAVTEGLNNYLRYLKRISFALPNFRNMRLRILAASS